MTEQRRSARGSTRRTVLKTLGAAGLAGVAGCLGQGGGGETTTDEETTSGGDSETTTAEGGSSGASSMTIFHAGSLAPPFGAAESAFEEQFGVEVNREAKGSVASTKKITEQGRKADALGVSDYRLIRDMAVPEFADWYTIFTTNSMSIQYREDSPGADEIATDNWWEVLSRDDVSIGHSDPAVDPGGYRAVMTMQLGAKEFEGSALYDDATYQQLRDNSTVPTGTETNLEGQLEAGKLDYVFYYQSISSTADLPYVDLQPEVDLSKATPKYAEHYAKAEVEAGDTTYVGAPIAYGLTVPSVAEAPDLGAKWAEFMITEPGRQILKDKGLVPVKTPVVPESGTDAVPDRVMQHASAQQSLGPLEL